MTTPVSVGFALCAVIAGCLIAAWWTATTRIDRHAEELANLHILVADLLGLTDEPDTDEYPAYVLADNWAADIHPTEPAEPVAPNWVEEQLATFTFMEGHQR